MKAASFDLSIFPSNTPRWRSVHQKSVPFSGKLAFVWTQCAIWKDGYSVTLSSLQRLPEHFTRTAEPKPPGAKYQNRPPLRRCRARRLGGPGPQGVGSCSLGAANDNVWVPLGFSVRYWSRLLASPQGDLYFARHTRHAPAEMASLAGDVRGFLGERDAPELQTLLASINTWQRKFDR